MGLLAALRGRQQEIDHKKTAELWAEYRGLLEKDRDVDAARVLELVGELDIDDRLLEVHRVAIEQDRTLEERERLAEQLQAQSLAAEQAQCAANEAFLKARRELREATEHWNDVQAQLAQHERAAEERQLVRAFFPALFNIPEEYHPCLTGRTPPGRLCAAFNNAGLPMPRLPGLSQTARDEAQEEQVRRAVGKESRGALAP